MIPRPEPDSGTRYSSGSVDPAICPVNKCLCAHLCEFSYILLLLVCCRDLLLLAGDSIRETETPVPLPAPVPRFPKTQATQTELPQPEDQTKETEQEEEQQLKKEDAVAGVERRRSSGGRGVWTWFRRLVGSILVLLLMFTLLGGLEYEGRIYGPMTYYPLRYSTYPSQHI